MQPLRKMLSPLAALLLAVNTVAQGDDQQGGTFSTDDYVISSSEAGSDTVTVCLNFEKATSYKIFVNGVEKQSGTMNPTQQFEIVLQDPLQEGDTVKVTGTTETNNSLGETLTFS